MNRIKFPNDFFDFNNGVPKSDSDIELYVNQMIEYLKENPEKQFTNRSQGNLSIIVYKYFYGDNDYSYTVQVSKGYFEKTIFSGQ